MSAHKIWASLHPFYERGPMLGRIEANRRFIRALLESDPFDAYHFFLPHPDDCAALQKKLTERFPEISAAGRFYLSQHRLLPGNLAERDYYCMHLSDPFMRYTDAMCLRNAFSRRIFPLTAPTHSLSYADYGEQFMRHLWGGTTSRDALAATSRAGLEVTRNYYARLQRNYALPPEKFPAPAVRHIPLGVDPSDLPAPEEKAALGAERRKELGLGDELVFLVFARLSYYSKMDPLPLLRALKRAEKAGLKPGSYCLVLAGWLEEEDDFGADIEKLAANLKIKCRIVARPDQQTRKELYALADLFLSPADNLQETFGLTLLEAAVSSLPVIASDFDGYKDLVLDGRTGLLIPTVGPSATPGTDALRDMVPNGEGHLLLAQQCVVEVEALGLAISRLALDADLRRKMGAAGRERALADFTWKRIIRLYLALWEELNEIPCALPENPRDRPLSALYHPAGPCYTEIFSGYFSRRAEDLAQSGHRLRLSKTGEAVYRGRDFPVIYRMIADRVDQERIRRLLFLARRPKPFALLRQEARELTPEERILDPDFLLLWAMKHDYLEFEPLLQGER
ncbi:MAG: glycosyltransferase family 4 protein [Desulfovibrionaceae bacterium]|nr:glycosyltransferase family 4 protein [Desulfovibrionaceae bacterium]